MNKVILFNPRSANNGKHRIPNSILQVGAAIHGQYDYVVVDGNMERDPCQKLKSYLDTGEFRYFGCTVMPGPQLEQAIPFTKRIRTQYPEVINIWGGYFPSNQYETVIQAPYVDYIVNGPGDFTFPQLLDALENEADLHDIPNLIFRENGTTVMTEKGPIPDQDELPARPYTFFNQFYPLQHYLGKTILGKKTAAYHSSIGCPFTCSFCAVVPIYNARWKGESAQNVYNNVKFLKDHYGADSIEFHDNNFFVSRKRTVEFARLIKPENMHWWGEGRIDTLNKYKDEDLALMREAGCRMIFLGAETGNDEVLAQMNKGGTQSGEQIKAFAERMRQFDIIPEYSFVLGTPAETPEKVMQQIEADIAFIKEIKEINPYTEIIIYIYSPVPTQSELYEAVQQAGFQFPTKLEEWLEPVWEQFDLRKNPLTPWLTPEMVDRIKGFETVLNAYYPSISDIKLTRSQKKVMRTLSAFRYNNNFFKFPYELKALQKFWLKYQQPEIEGFYME